MKTIKDSLKTHKPTETIELNSSQPSKSEDMVDFSSLYITAERFSMVKETEFFVDGFLAKDVITGIYGNHGIGKSMFMIALCQFLLLNIKDLKILYFDAENHLSTLKTRGVNKLLSMFENRFFLLNGEDENGNIQCHSRQFLDTYIPDDKNTLIILDSLRDFYPRGADINTDKSVDLLFDKLKMLRNNSAGVIFLHHPTKRVEDENGVIEPKGSGGIADNCDYYIQANKAELDNAVILLFEVTDYGKARGAFSPKAYEIPKTDEQMCHELEKGNMLLKECDYMEIAVLGNENNKLLVDELIEILSKTSDLKQKELIAKLQKATKLGHNLVFKFLKKFASYYCDIKIAERNARIYSLKQKYIL